MTVSLCVIAYNEEKVISQLLEYVTAQDYPHEKMEIVLVDSASTDNTKKLMEKFASEDNGFLRVKICDNPKKKQASGWNVAITQSECEIIFRIDAHAMIPKDFVSKNVECIKSGEYVSGGMRPNITDEDTNWKKTLLLAEKSMFGSSFASYRSGTKKQYVKSVFHGAYRREVFEKAGLFNENLGRTEDNEMHYRINQAGFKICYSPDIISYQHTRGTFKSIVKQKYGNGYWIGLTVGVCPKCLSLFHFVPFCFVSALIVTAILALFGFPLLLMLLGGAYAVANLLMSLASIISEKDRNLLFISLPFIFLSLHLAYGIGTIIGLIKMPFWVKKSLKQKLK